MGFMDSIHTSQQHSQSPSSQASFPILAFAVIGILTTALLLIGYYVFAIKCCLNSHNINIFNPFFISRSRRRQEPMIIYAPAMENHGLDASDIRSIPIVQFKKTELGSEQSFFECAVCLSEFQEAEKLRILPKCSHLFHIDCIDVWLQNNANCPLCRSSISISTPQPQPNQVATISPPHDQTPFTNTIMGGDRDFVVIEVINGDVDTLDQPTVEDMPVQPRNPSPKFGYKKARKFHHVSSMGDECINVRAKDDQFSVQPIRRSISMDSSADRQLFLSIQDIIQQSKLHPNEECTNEGCSSSSTSTSASKLRRSIFSFGSLGQGRGSRNAVLPIRFEQQN